MCFKDGAQYTNATQFTQQDIIAITPDQNDKVQHIFEHCKASKKFSSFENCVENK